jgi:hypothetical protein
MAWSTHKPFRSGETWAWNALTLSVFIWAALEFCFKLIEGINGIGLFAHFSLLIAFAVPLLATFRYFHPVTLPNAEQEVPYKKGILS